MYMDFRWILNNMGNAEVFKDAEEKEQKGIIQIPVLYTPIELGSNKCCITTLEKPVIVQTDAAVATIALETLFEHYQYCDGSAITEKTLQKQCTMQNIRMFYRYIKNIANDIGTYINVFGTVYVTKVPIEIKRVSKKIKVMQLPIDTETVFVPNINMYGESIQSTSVKLTSTAKDPIYIAYDAQQDMNNAAKNLYIINQKKYETNYKIAQN